MANDSLMQKKVEIYLNTPLFPFRYKAGKVKMQFHEDITHVSGMVLEERSSGFVVGIDAVSNQKETDESPPFKTIFLPLHKIDFIICA